MPAEVLGGLSFGFILQWFRANFSEHPDGAQGPNKDIYTVLLFNLFSLLFYDSIMAILYNYLTKDTLILTKPLLLLVCSFGKVSSIASFTSARELFQRAVAMLFTSVYSSLVPDMDKKITAKLHGPRTAGQTFAVYLEHGSLSLPKTSAPCTYGNSLVSSQCVRHRYLSEM